MGATRETATIVPPCLELLSFHREIKDKVEKPKQSVEYAAQVQNISASEAHGLWTAGCHNNHAHAFRSKCTR